MFMPMIFQYMLTIQNAAGFLGSNSSQCGLAAFRCYLHPAIQPLRRGFVVGPLCYPTTSKWCRVLYLATPFLFSSHFSHTFSRKRPRRVLSKKALSLNIVIKHCLKFCWSDGCLERLSSKTAQSSAEVMAVFKDCHQRLPKVLLKSWLSLKIVTKDCPKFCWSDGCLERLSSKTAQSSAEVMAVFKDCHQRLPKVLLKWWLSSKTSEKTANLRLEKKIREKTANLQRLEKRTREKTAEKDC